MPCVELSLPPVGRETRAKLAREITEAFCGCTGHPAEIFGIRFFEYQPEMASHAGELCDVKGNKPYLHMMLYCPRLSHEVKRKVGAALTEAVARGTGRTDWVPFIHISEHPYENIVVGGKLLMEAFEECAKRPFYYQLPKG